MKSQKSKKAKEKKIETSSKATNKEVKGLKDSRSSKKKHSGDENVESSRREEHKHEQHPAKGFEPVYYSRVKRERGSGMYGGQGYTSRGGYGRRG